MGREDAIKMAWTGMGAIIALLAMVMYKAMVP